MVKNSLEIENLCQLFPPELRLRRSQVVSQCQRADQLKVYVQSSFSLCVHKLKDKANHSSRHFNYTEERIVEKAKQRLRRTLLTKKVKFQF